MKKIIALLLTAVIATTESSVLYAATTINTSVNQTVSHGTGYMSVEQTCYIITKTTETCKSGSKTISGKVYLNEKFYRDRTLISSKAVFKSGVKVKVTYNNKTYTATTTSTGTFKVNVPTLKVGKKVYIEYSYKNGCTSKIYTIANQKLTTPIVTKYEKNTKTVSGKAKAGTTVYVTYNSKVYKATVKSNGTYSVSTAKLIKDKKVSVKIVDSVGNYSSAKSVKVR